MHDHAKLAKEDDYGEGNFGFHLFFISFLSFKTDGYCVDYFVCFDFLTKCLQNKAFARHRLLLPITKYSVISHRVRFFIVKRKLVGKC